MSVLVSSAHAFTRMMIDKGLAALAVLPNCSRKGESFAHSHFQSGNVSIKSALHVTKLGQMSKAS